MSTVLDVLTHGNTALEAIKARLGQLDVYVEGLYEVIRNGRQLTTEEEAQFVELKGKLQDAANLIENTFIENPVPPVA